MPTSFVFTNKQDTEDYWAPRLDLCDQRVLLRHAEKMRAIKRTNCSSFDTRSLFAKFERGLAPPCMPTTTILSFKTEKECSTGDVAANQERPVHTQLRRRPGLAKPPEDIITSYNNPYNRGWTPSKTRDAALARMQKPSVKLPLAASPPVDVVTIDLNGYSLMKKISKLHVTVVEEGLPGMDGSLYNAWATDHVSRPRPSNLTFKKSSWFKHIKRRLRTIRATR